MTLQHLSTAFSALRTPVSTRFLSTRASNVLEKLGLPLEKELMGVYDGSWKGNGPLISSTCPTTGETLASVRSASVDDLRETIAKGRDAYMSFRSLPAPRRGEVLRQIRELLAINSGALGDLVALEMGKIKTEGKGEVQEFVDICDYAVGLSRSLNGTLIPSERPGHTIIEIPNPLGVVGVVSAFNFPVAVYGWNLALSLITGNATIWKPAPSTPLISIAVTRIIASVLEKNGLPGAICSLVIGDQEIGESLVGSKDVDLVSFTGSERAGRQVGKTVANRFGKVILELGGNNASIIMPDADLGLAVPAVGFGAIGTAGQRCTSTRRLYLHRKIADEFLHRLKQMYQKIKPGDPLNPATFLGPVHSNRAAELYNDAVQHLRITGSEILIGGKRYGNLEGQLSHGFFVEPTISMPKTADPKNEIWNTETFVPILNVAIFDDIQEAISWNNAVPQGLSSSLWTRDIRNIGLWISPSGSDTGIVNVNVGTSGAEIGAGFGGNKSTGWGREAGNESWKQYVRWGACTINYSDAAPLAQGVSWT